MGYISTGKAAKCLSVSPDTVLKWVKRGLVPAVKTAGGHYRISEENVQSMLCSAGEDICPDRAGESLPFVHCWEFFARGGQTKEGCRQCLVYLAQADKCYEMSKLPAGCGFQGTFCKASCEECPYYVMQWNPAQAS